MEADGRQVTTAFTVQPSALDKPSIMKRYHRRQTCSHTSPHRLPTMVTLHDTRFVECRWLDCESCRHLTVVYLHDTGPRPYKTFFIEIDCGMSFCLCPAVFPPFQLCLGDRLVALVVKASASRAADLRSVPVCTVDHFPG